MADTPGRETIVRALAKADGLDWDEQCGYEISAIDLDASEECDSSTCVAAHYEDHDPETARRNYYRQADAVLALAPASSLLPGWEVVEAADRVVAAFEAFNDAEHNRQDCPECENEGPWLECERCSVTVGELLNSHLLAIEAYKARRAEGKLVGDDAICRAAERYGASVSWANDPGEFEHLIEFTPSRLKDFVSAHSPDAGGGIALPRDISAKVLGIGRAEWGRTPAHNAEGHGRHVAESVRLTAEHFQQEGPQEMHGLYVEGTEKVICHTGTGPNSPQVARALAGAWNQLHDIALAQKGKPA